jgi:hypothetical protein
MAVNYYFNCSSHSVLPAYCHTFITTPSGLGLQGPCLRMVGNSLHSPDPLSSRISQIFRRVPAHIFKTHLLVQYNNWLLVLPCYGSKFSIIYCHAPLLHRHISATPTHSIVHEVGGRDSGTHTHASPWHGLLITRDPPALHGPHIHGDFPPCRYLSFLGISALGFCYRPADTTYSSNHNTLCHLLAGDTAPPSWLIS